MMYSIFWGAPCLIVSLKQGTMKVESVDFLLFFFYNICVLKGEKMAIVISLSVFGYTKYGSLLFKNLNTCYNYGHMKEL